MICYSVKKASSNALLYTLFAFKCSCPAYFIGNYFSIQILNYLLYALYLILTNNCLQTLFLLCLIMSSLYAVLCCLRPSVLNNEIDMESGKYI